MIFEMRTYTIKIGQLKNYINHFESVGMPIISKYSTLVGYWYTEIGELNQIIQIWSYKDLNEGLVKSIEHFFEHYKDLEPEKWVKVDGWADIAAAKEEIEASVARYNG